MTKKESLVEGIKSRIRDKPPPVVFPPSSPEDIDTAEEQLGFSLPPLLRDLYCQVANGGIDSGEWSSGVIGVGGGHESDFGDVVETYAQLKGDQEAEGNTWPIGLLPFYEWGCNTFSCVQCDNAQIYTFEDFKIFPQSYSLEDFFEMWLSDVDILGAHGDYQVIETEITNPFTGEKSVARMRRRAD